MAEECGFQKVRRHGTGVHRHERTIVPRRIQVQRFGDHFLARAALALQQHGGAAVRHLRHQVEDLQHRLALADDILEVVALLEGALELNVLLFGAPAAHGGAYIGEKFFVVPGLLNEVRRPALHGAHRIFHGAESGDHDHRQAVFLAANFRQNLHPVAAGQS